VTTKLPEVRRAIDDNGTAARFNDPEGIAIDASGNLYVADRDNNRIRKIDVAGNVTTLSRFRVSGNADGAASVAHSTAPYGLLMPPGTCLLPIMDNHRIRK
jgi:DNA-binding beta-propeller fold protein YncE